MHYLPRATLSNSSRYRSHSRGYGLNFQTIPVPCEGRLVSQSNPLPRRLGIIMTANEEIYWNANYIIDS